MIFTIFYGIYFLLLLLSTIVVIIPYYLLKLFRLNKTSRNYMDALSSFYSRGMLRTGGVKIEVSGTENIPSKECRITIVANHQSVTDVPILRGYIPVMAGFIAKKELSRIPLIRTWLYAAGCLILDRGNRRSAIEMIGKGVESIRNGKPLIIFPEGTRGRNGNMLPFKKGSLKLASRSESVIIPVSIDGSYRIWEEKHRITPCIVRLTIHPVVNTAGMAKEELSLLAGKLQDIISEGVNGSDK